MGSPAAFASAAASVPGMVVGEASLPARCSPSASFATAACEAAGLVEVIAIAPLRFDDRRAADEDAGFSHPAAKVASGFGGARSEHAERLRDAFDQPLHAQRRLRRNWPRGYSQRLHQREQAAQPFERTALRAANLAKTGGEPRFARQLRERVVARCGRADDTAGRALGGRGRPDVGVESNRVSGRHERGVERARAGERRHQRRKPWFAGSVRARSTRRSRRRTRGRARPPARPTAVGCSWRRSSATVLLARFRSPRGPRFRCPGRPAGRRLRTHRRSGSPDSRHRESSRRAPRREPRRFPRMTWPWRGRSCPARPHPAPRPPLRSRTARPPRPSFLGRRTRPSTSSPAGFRASSSCRAC